MANGAMSVIRNIREVYEYLCRPICKEANIQQGELNVLLFLGNNPEKNTAVDIHKCGGIKQSMVSFLVEKLVQGGYLDRQSIPGDRRKVKLVCTEKAAPVIQAGQEAQKKLFQYMGEGVRPEDREAFRRVMETIEQNVIQCRELMLKDELEQVVFSRPSRNEP